MAARPRRGRHGPPAGRAGRVILALLGVVAYAAAFRLGYELVKDRPE